MAALEKRIAVAVDGDDEAVLGADALAAADALWDAGTRDGSVAIEAVHLVGLLHWLRYLALPIGADRLDFERAVELFDAVAAAAPEAVPEPIRPYLRERPLDGVAAAAWAGRGQELLAYALDHDDPDALDAVIEILTRCTAEPDHATGEQFSLLGVALLMRAERSGSAADIDAAIVASANAIGSADDEQERAGRLNNHANALAARAEQTGSRDDLDRAIAAAREAVATAAPSDRANFRSNLALSLHARFRHSDDPADLVAAETAAREAVTEDADDHPGYRSNLALVLSARYEQNSDPRLLDEAIELCRQAVDGAPAEHFDNARTRTTLAAALARRFENSGTDSDLETAIDELWLAAAATENHHHLHTSVQVNLATVLLTRYERGSDQSDLDASIRAATAATPDDPGAAILPALLVNQANALYARYERIGAHDDLGAAIAHYRRGTGLPQPSIDRAALLSNLGVALHARYEDTDQIDDLNEAIAAHRSAVRATPRGHHRLASWQSNLATALMARFENRAVQTDLDEALDLLDQVRQAADPGGIDSAHASGNLGTALYTAAERSDDPEGLDQAIALLRAAAACLGVHHPDGAMYLLNACAALRTRYHHSADPADLEAAVTEATAALAGPAAGNAVRANGLLNLASALRARAELERDRGEPWRPLTHRAIVVGEQAADELVTPAETRISAARECALAAAMLGDPARALGFYRRAVELVQRLAVHGTERMDRERSIGSWQGLAAEAAAYAVGAGEPETAVALLETGRAVLWNQLVRNRTEVDDALAANSELGTELLAQLHVLDPASVAMFRVPGAAVDPEQRRARAVAASRRFDSLLAEIRALPGLSRFMRGLEPSELCAPIVGGRVVMVNVAPRRCDALVVTHDGVHAIPLRALTAADATRYAAGYLAALGVLESPRRGRLAKTVAAEVVRDTLRWLWQVVAEPILCELGLLEPVSASTGQRIWWCPTGVLSALPIHAAGDDTDVRHPAPHVLDLVVSSYTPTIGALSTRLGRPTHSSAGPGVFVGMPTTPGERDLPQVEIELQTLSGRFPEVVSTQLIGPNATRAAVLDALATHPRAHVSCHGRVDRATPSTGGIVLHDGILTVADVATATSGAHEFAFLSACHTHPGQLSGADEVISLAAALAYTGRRDLVATLWSVDADHAAAATAAFYQHLNDTSADGSASVARALHAAVRTLRDRDVPPRHWGSFVHIGA
ncbi:CHAT domain-containing protein [Nocardia sp. NPDC057353]|uniref:CHAT domain-containing protein n=1 Tax=Nocardia sp. NPDC057353 TaxID=3346104 RepID=UPI0036450DE0